MDTPSSINLLVSLFFLLGIVAVATKLNLFGDLRVCGHVLRAVPHSDRWKKAGLEECHRARPPENPQKKCSGNALHGVERCEDTEACRGW